MLTRSDIRRGLDCDLSQHLADVFVHSNFDEGEACVEIPRDSIFWIIHNQYPLKADRFYLFRRDL